MKKTVLVLAVLILAAPAWATVYITATDEGSGVVRIDYNSVGEPNRVRAFALDITITDGNIVDINDYFVGECDDVNRGHGIFPGTIDINSAGVVNDWGSPVAPANAPGAYGGIGTGGITIEMGSLFVDPNYPSDSGILCRVTVSADCNLSVTTNIVRGGVVLEDPSVSPTVDLSGATDIPVYTGCFPQGHPDWGEWDSVGRPDCWCYTRQCHGDVDDNKQGSGLFGYYYVGSYDLTVLINAYKVKEPPKGLGIDTVSVDRGDGVYIDGICADVAHDQQGSGLFGYYRVGSSDLNILIPNYKVKEPPKGLGIDPNCP